MDDQTYRDELRMLMEFTHSQKNMSNILLRNIHTINEDNFEDKYIFFFNPLANHLTDTYSLYINDFPSIKNLQEFIDARIEDGKMKQPYTHSLIAAIDAVLYDEILHAKLETTSLDYYEHFFLNVHPTYEKLFINHQKNF